MSDRRLREQAGLELVEDQEIVLAGEPRALRGVMQVRNAGQERIAVREAWLRRGEDRGKRSLAAPILRASLSATVHPGEEQKVVVTVEIDRQTPPGEYQAEVEVAGQARPVVVQVAEVVRLGILPRPVVIDEEPGSTVVKRLVLTNDGNVPLTIGEIASVRLAEELPLARSMRATIGAVSGQRQSLEEFFAEIVRDEARLVMRQIGVLDVRNPEAPITIEPGAVRSLDLQIHLPDKIEPGRRYLGRAPLYTSDIEFIVVPVSREPRKTEGPVESEQTPKGANKT